MPHRKSPRGYAINLLQREACFDLKSKELVNLLSAGEVEASLASEFPGVDFAAVVPEVGVVVEGLVLRDRRGDGALQPPRVGKVPLMSFSEFMRRQREEACKTKGAL